MQMQFLALLAALLFGSIARAEEPIPTHCKSNEFAFVSAKMYKAVEGTYLGDDTGKILSLCADRNTEPFEKFVYRYGAIGKVEMEKIATKSDKFGLFTQSDAGAHAGQTSVSFAKGKYIYEVGEGMGMTMGVRLYVYRSGELILSLISDHHYESNMTLINFEKASSPIFKVVKAPHPW